MRESSFQADWQVILVMVVMVMLMVIRWCEKTGKANKREVSFYKAEFRYLNADQHSDRGCCRKLLRCETKREFVETYTEKKKLWTLPGYVQYFEKHVLKGIDRSGLWTAREHDWKVLQGCDHL